MCLFNYGEKPDDNEIKVLEKIKELLKDNCAVMVILGNTKEINNFVNKARGIAKNREERRIVWIQDDRILSSEKVIEWFDNDITLCALVFNHHGLPPILLKHDENLYRIDKAFLYAYKRGS